MKVLPFVEHLANVEDVRDVIRKSVDGGFVNYNVVNDMIRNSKGNGATKEKEAHQSDNNGIANNSNSNINVNRISYTDRNVSTLSSSKQKANVDRDKLRESVGIAFNDIVHHSNSTCNSTSSGNGIKTLKNSISSNTVGNGISSVSSLSTFSILNRNKGNPFVLDMNPIMLNTSLYKDGHSHIRNYNNDRTNGNDADENDFYSKAYEGKRLTSSRTQNNIILPSNDCKPLQSNPNRKEIKKHFFSPKHTVMSLYTSNTSTNSNNNNNNTFGNLDDTLNQITTTSFNRHLSSSNYLHSSGNKFSLSRSSEKKCNVFSKENTSLNGSISSTDIKRISLHTKQNNSKPKEFLLHNLERKINYIKTPTATISLHEDNSNNNLNKSGNSKLKQIRIYTSGNYGKSEMINKSCSNIKKKHFITKIQQHDI